VEKNWLSSAKTAPACAAPDCPVVHRTVSGTQAGSAVNSSLLGKSEGAVAKNYRTVRCANGAHGQRLAARSSGDTWPRQRSTGHTNGRQCPVRQWDRASNSRLRPIRKEIRHRTGTVHVRWCTGVGDLRPPKVLKNRI
jgi:hypothetical protein